MERILGVDVGLKRTGIAMGISIGRAIRVFPPLQCPSRQCAVECLMKICQEEEITCIVFGLPVMPQSREITPIGRRSEALAEAFKNACDKQNISIRIAFVEENYSSLEANKRLQERGVLWQDRREKIDGEAAAIIVETYIMK